MKRLLATMALLASLGTAHASPAMSATEWIKQCDDKLLTFRTLCSRYALGVADGLVLWLAADKNAAPVCFPPNVTADQLVAVAQKYYKDNPKDRHNNARSLLGLAYLDAWPCVTEKEVL